MAMSDGFLFGVTMGDSSGIGPELVLKAFRNGELQDRTLLFGDMAVVDFCNRKLGYGVPLHAAENASDLRDGALNVRDFGMMRAEDVTAGRINKLSGAAARAYVVAAAEAALRGEIAGMVTLPMNKEATQ